MHLKTHSEFTDFRKFVPLVQQRDRLNSDMPHTPSEQTVGWEKNSDFSTARQVKEYFLLHVYSTYPAAGWQCYTRLMPAHPLFIE